MVVYRYFLEIWEGLLIALRAIQVHKLRAILTTLGIIIGITSVTSMVTIINGLEQQFDEDMASLGTDVLYIEKWPWMTGPSFKWWEYINRPRITDDLVPVIERRSRYATAVAPVIETYRPLKYKGQTTTRVSIEASTPTYERIHTIKIAEGRFYNDMDQRVSRNVVVIGGAVPELLFGTENPIGKTIRLGPHPFQVIGVQERKGKGSNEQNSEDYRVRIPISTFKNLFGGERRDYSIRVKITQPELIDVAQDELTGILRAARRLDARDDDDFVINQQKTLRAQIAPVKTAIYGIGLFLTALSLLVGGIGVMNIMFVSVKERTREIGIRKAVGAKRRTILTQFLIEAVIVCMIGGLIAVSISALLTQLIRMAMPAYLPFTTVLMAFGICMMIGIVFGMAPAYTAAKSEPIEALRYE